MWRAGSAARRAEFRAVGWLESSVHPRAPGVPRVREDHHLRELSSMQRDDTVTDDRDVSARPRTPRS